MPPSKPVRAVLVMALAAALCVGALALPSTSATAAEGSWFHDPVSPANRAAQVAVPRQPGHTTGERVRRTRATYRARNGSIAVPVSWARGHTLTVGQAVVMQGRAFTYDDGRPSAATRRTVLRLTRSLTGVHSVRCQGHADFGGTPGGEKLLSRQRARAVCALIARHTSGISTRSYGFGIFRPVVIGGRERDRIDNRRVVVKVVRAATVAVPAAPHLSRADTDGTSMTIGFERPADDGGPPITAYQASLDGGRTWDEVVTSGDGPFSVTIRDLIPWTRYTVAVRAVNEVGAGAASNTIEATTDPVVPDAPRLSTVDPDRTSMTIGFERPGYDGDAAITQYQASLDGGATWRDVATSGDGPFSVVLTGLAPGTGYTVAVRAMNRVGAGAQSNRIATTTLPAATVATAPTIVSVIRGNEGTSPDTVFYGDMQFAAPTSNGGAPITGYEHSLDGGPWTPLTYTGSGPYAARITYPDNGCSFTHVIRAVNSVGPGAASSAVESQFPTGRRAAVSSRRGC